MLQLGKYRQNKQRKHKVHYKRGQKALHLDFATATTQTVPAKQL